MFMKSAAADTLQGRAIQNVNKQWGDDFRKWIGRETIGIPVCKKKYSPFMIIKKVNPKNGKVDIRVQRTYGCHCHSHLRKKVIEQNGERKGWEPFGQWSLSKATVLARRAMENIKNILNKNDEHNNESNDTVVGKIQLKKICQYGSCAWKIKRKYDDISDELNQESQCTKAT